MWAEGRWCSAAWGRRSERSCWTACSCSPLQREVPGRPEPAAWRRAGVRGRQPVEPGRRGVGVGKNPVALPCRWTCYSLGGNSLIFAAVASQKESNFISSSFYACWGWLSRKLWEKPGRGLWGEKRSQFTQITRRVRSFIVESPITQHQSLKKWECSFNHHECIVI